MDMGYHKRSKFTIREQPYRQKMGNIVLLHGHVPNVLGHDEILYSNTADPFCISCS